MNIEPRKTTTGNSDQM